MKNKVIFLTAIATFFLSSFACSSNNQKSNASDGQKAAAKPSGTADDARAQSSPTGGTTMATATDDEKAPTPAANTGKKGEEEFIKTLEKIVALAKTLVNAQMKDDRPEKKSILAALDFLKKNAKTIAAGEKADELSVQLFEALEKSGFTATKTVADKAKKAIKAAIQTVGKLRKDGKLAARSAAQLVATVFRDLSKELKVDWLSAVDEATLMAALENKDVLKKLIDGAGKKGDEKSGDEKSGDEKSGDEKSGDEKSGDEKSGDEKSGDEKSGDE